MSSDDYVQLVQNLVQQARMRFRQAILEDESGFRRALLDETLATQSSIGDMQATLAEMRDYLAIQFGIQLSSRLDEIAGNVKAIQHMLLAGAHDAWVNRNGETFWDSTTSLIRPSLEIRPTWPLRGADNTDI